LCYNHLLFCIVMVESHFFGVHEISFCWLFLRLLMIESELDVHWKSMIKPVQFFVFSCQSSIIPTWIHVVNWMQLKRELSRRFRENRLPANQKQT
jgi:hypothetical protein